MHRVAAFGEEGGFTINSAQTHRRDQKREWVAIIIVILFE